MKSLPRPSARQCPALSFKSLIAHKQKAGTWVLQNLLRLSVSCFSVRDLVTNNLLRKFSRPRLKKQSPRLFLSALQVPHRPHRQKAGLDVRPFALISVGDEGLEPPTFSV